ncbi:MAG: Exodeoxyribonuclease 7 large subunit, partial [Patescibacteria group bacterium]|nr:Exodeoxyribonuclease 7 large subunit [Patescibacteria group bacterium]
MIQRYLLKENFMDVRGTLWQWRRRQAEQEGVEVFRVLPNAVLEALLAAEPRTKEELLAIKGIKEAKYRKYGKAILEILAISSERKPVVEQVESSTRFPKIDDERFLFPEEETVTEE